MKAQQKPVPTAAEAKKKIVVVADFSVFAGRFERVTEPQALAWPEIRAGRDVLIAAPTGSGKTLAAFLICLDGLVRTARSGPRPTKSK